MYPDLPALWRGMTKTAFTAARDRGSMGWLLGGLTFLGVGLLIGVGWGLLNGLWGMVAIGVGVWLLNGILLLPWLRRFEVSPAFGYALLNLPALGMLWLIGMVSTFRTLFNLGVRWKGRTIVESRVESPTESITRQPTAVPKAVIGTTTFDAAPIKGKQP